MTACQAGVYAVSTQAVQRTVELVLLSALRFWSIDFPDGCLEPQTEQPETPNPANHSADQALITKFAAECANDDVS